MEQGNSPEKGKRAFVLTLLLLGFLLLFSGGITFLFRLSDHDQADSPVANNSITGLAGKEVFSSGSVGFGMQQVFIFLGMVVIVGLVAYYFFFLKSEEGYTERESRKDESSLFINHSGKAVPEIQVDRDRSAQMPVVEHQARGIQVAVVGNRRDAGFVMPDPAGREKSREGDVRRLALETKKLLDNLDVAGAYSFYVTLVDLYPHLGGQSDELAGHAQDIYARLFLVGALERCRGKGLSLLEVDALLGQIDSIFAENGADSRFMQYLRVHQNYLLQYKVKNAKKGC